MFFVVFGENLDAVQCKSVYKSKKRLAKDGRYIGEICWMLRLKVSKNGTGLIIYNGANESIRVEDNRFIHTFEFAKNKLLVTDSLSHMYLIINWSTVKCIPD